MTVDYCRYCRHAQQIHKASDNPLCRGRCWHHQHTMADHTGACTSHLCRCDEFVRPAA